MEDPPGDTGFQNGSNTAFSSGCEDREVPVVRVNLGLHFALVSALGYRQMRRDRETLSRILLDAGMDLEGASWGDMVRDFILNHPRSPHQNLAQRALFRMQMETQYPLLPGSVIRGKLFQTVGSGEKRPVTREIITLDGFQIASSDRNGDFIAEGIPLAEGRVLLSMGIESSRFVASRPVTLHLPPGRAGTFRVDLPVRPLVDDSLDTDWPEGELARFNEC